jgi:ribosome-associated heat shock protein Hsp15
VSDSPETSLRLDKWLWQARFARTRSLAAKLVAEARFRINGNPTEKAHHAVRPGDVLTFALGPHIRVVKVLALGLRRGPAPGGAAAQRRQRTPAAETGRRERVVGRSPLRGRGSSDQARTPPDRPPAVGRIGRRISLLTVCAVPVIAGGEGLC